MNKKILGLSLIALVEIIAVSLFSFTSCSKDEGENDEDSITGIWYPAKNYDDTTLTDCERHHYYQFSEYALDSIDRTVYYYYACPHDTLEYVEQDEGGFAWDTVVLPPYKIQHGYYTIKDSVLTIRNMKNVTTEYIIKYIKKEKMVLKSVDRNGEYKEEAFYRKD